MDAVKALLFYNLGCSQGWLLGTKAPSGSVLTPQAAGVEPCLENLRNAAKLGREGIEAIGKDTVERDFKWDQADAPAPDQEGDLVELYRKGSPELKLALEGVKQELLTSAAKS